MYIVQGTLLENELGASCFVLSIYKNDSNTIKVLTKNYKNMKTIEEYPVPIGKTG